jgi:hypothetical protein
MGWVTLRLGWESNLITEAIFYIGVIGTLWAVLGYFSYRWFRGRDCWCGSGPVIPCVGWLCCFSERYLGAFHRLHEGFMVLIFGVEFFATLADKRRGGDDSGQSYEATMRTHNLRRIPYYLYERGQIFREFMSDEPVPARLNAKDSLKVLEGQRARRRNDLVVPDREKRVQGTAGSQVVELVVSPLVEKQRVSLTRIRVHRGRVVPGMGDENTHATQLPDHPTSR